MSARYISQGSIAPYLAGKPRRDGKVFIVRPQPRPFGGSELVARSDVYDSETAAWESGLAGTRESAERERAYRIQAETERNKLKRDYDEAKCTWHYSISANREALRRCKCLAHQ